MPFYMGQNPMFLTLLYVHLGWIAECGSWTVQVSYFASHTQNYLVTLWKAKVPSKVQVLTWIIAHGRMIICDLVQKRRPNWWPPTLICDV